jgi:hypothetical protein
MCKLYVFPRPGLQPAHGRTGAPLGTRRSIDSNRLHSLESLHFDGTKATTMMGLMQRDSIIFKRICVDSARTYCAKAQHGYFTTGQAVWTFFMIALALAARCQQPSGSHDLHCSAPRTSSVLVLCRRLALCTPCGRCRMRLQCSTCQHGLRGRLIATYSTAAPYQCNTAKTTREPVCPRQQRAPGQLLLGQDMQQS